VDFACLTALPMQDPTSDTARSIELIPTAVQYTHPGLTAPSSLIAVRATVRYGDDDDVVDTKHEEIGVLDVTRTIRA
jgi:hypothetical protein